MKTIILCGGFGTRLKEETEFRPKPMIKVGGRPILWHVMKIYAHHGFNEFVLALGYKGEMIKSYFLNQRTLLSDFTLDIPSNEIKFHNDGCDNFKVTFAETGLNSLTGERILRAKKYIDEDGFMVTYGDGVSDINISELVDFHKKQGTVGTIACFHPHSKYGLVKADQGTALAADFHQKPIMPDYVSGGFMVFKKEALDYFDNGQMEDGLKKMAKDGQLSVFEYKGFWKAMDTYREKEELEELWKNGKPWVIWENK
jgi:glucose-1-phosphate cytidylyltransferase